MFSENGIINSSPQYKDNNFILSSHDNNSYNNNLNSYAKSTPNSTNSSNASTPKNVPSSPSSSPASPSFAHQLRILIPNYDDLMDTIRSQQPHSSSRGMGNGNDRRNMNMMNDRRMMDRQMVS